jgi:hypothetical protein
MVGEKGRLAGKEGGRLDRAEARTAKRRVARIFARIEEWQLRLSILRSLGDCLVFIYVNKWDIKPFARKEHAGFITGKQGLRFELKVLRLILSAGIPAILADITNCVRHGDILVIKDGLPIPLECKSGRETGDRSARQSDAAQAVLDYLRTGTGQHPSFPGWTMRRVPLAVTERSHRRAFANTAARALRNGWAVSFPERGLGYLVFHSVPTNAILRRVVRRFREPPMWVGVSGTWRPEPYYYPLALALDDPEVAWSLYVHEVTAVVFIDRAYLIQRARDLGADIRFVDDGEWMMEVTVAIGGEPAVMKVAGQFFLRVAFELSSIEWFVQELVRKATLTNLNSSSDSLDVS